MIDALLRTRLHAPIFIVSLLLAACAASDSLPAETHVERAELSTRQAVEYIRSGSYEWAVREAETAHSHASRIYRADSREMAHSYALLGDARWPAGERDKAYNDYRVAERILREQGDTVASEFYGVILRNVVYGGIQLQRTGRGEREAQQRLLDQVSSHHGPSSPEYGATLVGLGRSHLQVDSPSEARELFRRAIAVHGPPGTNVRARVALWEIARLGAPTTSDYQYLLDGLEIVLSPDYTGSEAWLGALELGTTFQAERDCRRAYLALDRAAQLQLTEAGPNELGQGDLYRTEVPLAETLRCLGKWREAEKILWRTLERGEKLSAGWLLGTTGVLRSLSEVSMFQQQHHLAAGLADRAIEVARLVDHDQAAMTHLACSRALVSALGSGPDAASTASRDCGSDRGGLGDRAHALAISILHLESPDEEDKLEGLETLGFFDPDLRAKILLVAGLRAASRGMVKVAERLGDSALAAIKEIPVPVHPLIPEYWLLVSRYKLAATDLSGAKRAAELAVELIRELQRNDPDEFAWPRRAKLSREALLNAATVNVRMATAADPHKHQYLTHALEFSLEANEQADLAFGLGQSLEEVYFSSLRSRWATRLPTAPSSWLGEWSAARADGVLIQGTLKLARQKSFNSARRVEAPLRERNRVEFECLQSLLQPDERLLFVISSESETFVWLIGRDEIAFNASPLGTRALDALVGEIRDSIETSVRGGFPFEASYEIYRSLLGPLEKALRKAKRLTVVSDSPLTKIPLSVLVTEEPGPISLPGYAKARWMQEELDLNVAYSSSVQQMWRSRSRSSEPRWNQGFLGLANPDVSWVKHRYQDDRSPESSLTRLPLSLSSAEEEIRVHARVLGKSAASMVLVDKDATEEALKALPLSEFRFLSFATHILPAGNSFVAGGQAAMMLAKSTDGGEDGYLTAGEIFELDLNAEWILLSGCDSLDPTSSVLQAGAGDLAHAFLASGASSLLLTYWELPSRAARDLISHLLELLEADPQISRAQALRQAEAWIRNNAREHYAHPRYWAPFAVFGEGGRIGDSQPLLAETCLR